MIKQIIAVATAGTTGGSAVTILAPIPYEELAPEAERLYEVISPLKLSPLELLKLKKHLEEEGDKLRAVQHPFKFLEGIYRHPELCTTVHDIFATDGIMTGMKQDGFMKGVREGMEKYLRLERIDCYVDTFSTKVNVPAAELRDLIREQEWERLVRKIFVREG